MAAPAFVSATGHAGNPTTSATVTLPTTAANDILILVAVNAGAVTALTPSGTYSGGGWTSIGAGAGTAQWGGVWWSRATGNHSGQTVIVGTATDSCAALVMRVSGCLTGATPVDVDVSSANVTANGLDLAAFTTRFADELVCLAVAADDNIAMSGQTKNGVAMDERGEFASTGGADSIVGISTLAQAVAGTTGAFAGTHASALSKRLVAFALLPPRSLTVSPSGVASAEALGTPTVTRGAVTVSPSGVASAAAFGTPTVTRGAVTVSPSGVASAEAFGTPTVTVPRTVSPSGVASAEAFGTPTVTPGATAVSPSGVASAEALGTPTVTRGAVTVSPSGVASAEAFGAPTVNQRVSPSGVASAEAFGAPTVTPGTATVSPSGIASASAFGTPTVAPGAVAVSPTGIASTEAFGTPTVTRGAVTVSPSGVASAEAFGAPTVSADDAEQLEPAAIASAEAFGTPSVQPGAATVTAVGIASAEAFGTPILSEPTVQDLEPAGIASAEAFGTPTLSAVVVEPPASAPGLFLGFGAGGIVRETISDDGQSVSTTYSAFQPRLP